MSTAGGAASSSGGSGSGASGTALWIPFVATGSCCQLPSGLMLVPWNDPSGPAQLVTANEMPNPSGALVYLPVKKLGEALSYTVSGARVTALSPATIIYTAVDASGSEHVYGLDLRSATPRGQQLTSLSAAPQTIGSSAAPASRICDWRQGQGDLKDPRTLFVVLHLAGPGGCVATTTGGDRFLVVHYTDDASSAPAAVSIASTEFTALYAPDGTLGGIVLLDTGSGLLNFYADAAFIGFRTLADHVLSIGEIFHPSVGIEGVFTGTVFMAVRTASSQSLYQIDASGNATSRYTAAGTLTGGAADDSSFYFLDTTGSPGTGEPLEQTVWRAPILGGMPSRIATLAPPSYDPFTLVGSDGSRLVLHLQYTDQPHISRPVTVAVSGSSTSPTQLADFDASTEVVMSPPRPAPSDALVYVTLYAPNSPVLPAPWEAELLTPQGTVLQPLTAASLFEPLVDEFGVHVFELMGIKADDLGAYGGGPLYDASPGSTSAAFTAADGSPYTLPSSPGQPPDFLSLSGTRGAAAPAVVQPYTAAQTAGAVFDTATRRIYPVTVPDTDISLF